MPNSYVQLIDHYGTTHQDHDRTEDFYCRVLGGVVLRKRDYQITINLGDAPIAFFGDERRGLPYRPHDRGLPRIAYEIASEDFPRLVDRLRSAGRSLEGPKEGDLDDTARRRQNVSSAATLRGTGGEAPRGRVGGHSHLWLHDPEGNFLEFVDRGAPKRHPDEEIEFVRIDHLEYEDTDLDETADFCVNALGFEVAGRGNSPEGYPRLDVRVPASGQIIRFHQVAEPSILLTETWHGHHIALHVLPEDYDRTCRQLTEYGVALDREEHGQGEHKVVEHYFNGPQGHRFSIGTTRGERPVTTGAVPSPSRRGNR